MPAATPPAADADRALAIRLDQAADYRFTAQFDGTAIPPLTTDESAPLGADAGPNPARLVAVAVANCLAASLLFALRKFHQAPDPIRAQARLRLGRNAQNRWRIAGIDVDLHLGVAAAKVQQLERALAQFEDFCIVTQSLRAAFPVAVQVFDSDGRRLMPAQSPP